MRGDVFRLRAPRGTRGHEQQVSRYAVVVQSDHNNVRLTNSIFAMATSNTRLAAVEPAQVFIDVATPDGQASGLSRSSAVKCENLYTLPQAIVVRTIGRLSPALMQQVDDALKASLALP